MKKWTGYKNTAIIVILTVVIFSYVTSITQATSQFQKQLDMIKEVYELISEYHINNIDPDALAQGAIKGMLEVTGDDYTTFFTNEEFNSFKDDLDGNFTGIGIYVEEKNGVILVQAPIPNSPADKVGIKSGDIIIAVDNTELAGKSIEEAADLIRGQEGTLVKLTIKREQQLITFEVERAKISLPIVESKMLTDDIGYLKLYTFGNQSPEKFKTHLQQLRDSGMKKLILDLRGNPGGYLDSVLEIAKNFIEKGPIVYVQDKSQKERELGIENGNSWDLPMVVLINKGSASAAEILAGALQDYKKGIIIGERSFGKGTVQTLVPLENGGYLKLTVNEYFTPNKNKMNGIGVKPDIEVLQPDLQLSTAILSLTEDKQFRPTLGQEWIKVADKNLISLRKLIEYIGGEINWDPKLREIVIKFEDETLKLQTDSNPDTTIINGSTYLETTKIKELFPQIIIMDDGEKITIFYP
ncbi:hypothetical protein BHF71_01175 [Vulcanibacillus modesticaldus]|uniref:PDZ domain-containing protein n=1 Tax=Vulcanibacillus modesticaldus TaxID=337097 RepID=A0A1D2YVZ5_9BACI|nr:S41 family peptidase [Vulcanibacillus modesticaldus]OEF99817.1 hypothetical protein BHF71_01175 [Vulcanibacillus modesticaldus]